MTVLLIESVLVQIDCEVRRSLIEKVYYRQ